VARDSGEGRHYSRDDRWAAAVLGGYVGFLVTVIPVAILLTVLDAFHPMVVLVWVLLPGVVGYVAPGLFTRPIRRHDPYFGRRNEPAEEASASWAPVTFFPESSGSDDEVGGNRAAANLLGGGHSTLAASTMIGGHHGQLAESPSTRLISRWTAPDPDDPQSRRTAVVRLGQTCGVGVAPDGGWVASTGNAQGEVHIWDCVTGALRATLAGHSRRAYDAVIAPNGRALATGSYDQTVRIWDVESWRTVAILKGPTRENVAFWSLGFAPDGSWLAAADTSGVIGIWDTATWRLLTKLTGHYDGVLRVAVAPDGSWLAAGDNEGKLWIWDTETWQPRKSVTAHSKSCWGVAVAPDGTWLATGGGGDHLVRIWDTAEWLPTATLKGHQAGVDTVTIAATGQWLASGGADGVRLWEPRTGQELCALQTVGRVFGLAGLPDGSALAIGAQRGVHVLNLVTGNAT
jgi:hypothetical protein